jgi:3-oxoacyl-[acyl-carrier-protein] synthase-3
MATEIGALNALAYDLQAACSSCLVCQQQLPTLNLDGIKKYFLIGADKMSSIVDYTDRATCIIFGRWCAVLFEPNYEGWGLNEYLRSDG